MGMPRRHSRRLEVAGETFLWRMDRGTRYRGDAPLATRVTLQREEPRPADVRQLVVYALGRGWDPSARGPALKIDPGAASPDLGEYEMRPWR